MARAIRIHETGGPEVLKLENVEVGDPSPGQVRVRHIYVAVNFIDIYFRTGRYPMPLPNGLGSDAVGVVEAVGEGVTDIGVGLVACQWARALGVTMIGTVSSDEKAEIAKAHGCTHTIVTRREDIAKRVRELTGGKGVPVVYDSVGKDTLQASLDSLQPRGVLVSNGTSSGPVVIDTMQLAVKGSIWVTRPAMIHYATPRSHMLAMADELFGLVLAGKITSEPRQSFALSEAGEAHRALESRATTGATVLVP